MTGTGITLAARRAPEGLAARSGPALAPGGPVPSRLAGGAPDTSAPSAGCHDGRLVLVPASLIARLAAAGEEWQAARIGSEAEQDAAGAMYAAGLAVAGQCGITGDSQEGRRRAQD